MIRDRTRALVGLGPHDEHHVEPVVLAEQRARALPPRGVGGDEHDAALPRALDRGADVTFAEDRGPRDAGATRSLVRQDLREARGVARERREHVASVTHLRSGPANAMEVLDDGSSLFADEHRRRGAEDGRAEAHPPVRSLRRTPSREAAPEDGFVTQTARRLHLSRPRPILVSMDRTAAPSGPSGTGPDPALGLRGPPSTRQNSALTVQNDAFGKSRA